MIIKKTFADLSPEMIEEYFHKKEKCKVSWKVTDIIKNDINGNKDKLPCFISNNIKVKNNWTIDLFSITKTWNCEILTDNEYYEFNQYNILPKVWNTIYAIVDKKNYQILKYWKNDYEKYSEVPICENNNQYNYYYFWIWIICLIISLILIYKLIKKDK